MTHVYGSGVEEVWRFGEAVDIDGDLLLVGGKTSHTDIPAAGAAFLFEWNGFGWHQSQVLLPGDPDQSQRFGCSVALDGDVAVIGASQDDDSGSQSGAAYAFYRSANGWVQEAKLKAAVPHYSDNFGLDVAAFGDRIVVASPGQDPCGAVHVYRRRGGAWPHEQVIVLPNKSGLRQGNVVSAIWDDLLVVGRPADDGTGAVYIYEFSNSTWEFRQRIEPSNGVYGDDFGGSVAVHEDRIVIGSPRSGFTGYREGSVYVFERGTNSWIETAYLKASDKDAHDFFGLRVRLLGDTFVANAPGNDAGPNATGAVYTFQYTGLDWTETSVMRPLEGMVTSWWPEVAFDGERVAIGAEVDLNPEGDASGAVHVYGYGSPPPHRYCASNANSSGEAATIDIEGSRSIIQNDSVLLADHCPPGQPGFFICGAMNQELPMGNGFLCISPFSPGLVRLPSLTVTDANGTASYALDFTSAPEQGMITGGSAWNFQFWFRDPAAGGASFNLSDAIHVTFCP